jgi:hypothetical protein
LGSVGEANNQTTFGRQGDPMRRRELVLLLGGAMTAARPLRAQQKAMPVIGFLSSFPPPNLGDPDRARYGSKFIGRVARHNTWHNINWDNRRGQ